MNLVAISDLKPGTSILSGLLGIAWTPCYYATMIVSFKNIGTEDVFNGRATRTARRICPQPIWGVARRKLDQLDSATVLGDLRTPPGNRLERLTGNRRGEHSIRVNEQFRVCFVWTDMGPAEVEITDYH